MSEGINPDSPDTAVVDTEVQSALALDGLEEALNILPNDPPVEKAEDPEQAESADADAKEDTDSEEPPVEDEDNSEEDQPDEVSAVSFDGFSDESKTMFERLLKEGHITPEEVDRQRRETLMQSNYTKKTTALKEERAAFLAEHKDDLDLLEQIRADKRLSAAWDKMTTLSEGGEVEDGDEDDDELASRRDVRKEARRIIEQREAEKAARTKAQQQEYDTKVGATREALLEAMEVHGIEQEAASTYLQDIGSKVPNNADPILHYTPDQLAERLVAAHERATLEAENARLKEQLENRSKKSARTAKQSLQPPRRVPARDGPVSPGDRVTEELGLDPDWSNVQGAGAGPR